jgi:hypothetical protein
LYATFSVKSEEPDPVIEVGLKVPVTPDGTPVADSATGESNPPDAVTVTTAYPLCPWYRYPEVGETEIENVPFVAEVTVKETFAVCVMPPPVPVTVMV